MKTHMTHVGVTDSLDVVRVSDFRPNMFNLDSIMTNIQITSVAMLLTCPDLTLTVKQDVEHLFSYNIFFLLPEAPIAAKP